MIKTQPNIGFTLQYSLRWSNGIEIDLRKQTGIKFDLILPDDTSVRITGLGYDSFQNKVWVRVPAAHTTAEGVYRASLSVMTKDLQLISTGIHDIAEIDENATSGYQSITLRMDVVSVDTPVNMGQGYSPKIVNGEWYVFDDSQQSYVPTGVVIVSQASIDSAVNAEKALREAADTSLQSAIAAEATRATGKEQELETATTGLRSDLGSYEDNAEFLRVLTDSEGHFLCGFKKDGDVVFGVGVPSEVKKAIQNNSSEILTELNGKVDKVSGKQLSTEDFTSALKNKLTSIPDSVPSTSDLSQGLSEKVDKEEDKSLIANRLIQAEDNAEYSYIILDEDNHVLLAINRKGEIEAHLKGLDAKILGYISGNNEQRDKDAELSYYDVPRFFDNLTLMQNYYDDQMLEKHGQMLRTDTIVWNQANLGCNSKTNDKTGMKYIGDSTCNVMYHYYYWRQVQSAENEYDFSAIGNHISANYALGRRVIIGGFASCASATYYNTTTVDGIEVYYNFPDYVLSKMRQEGGQEVIYSHITSGIKYLLLDINCESVLAEYQKLLTAFANWVTTTEVASGVKMIDCILFIDNCYRGPWGEGGWYGLKATASVSHLISYTSKLLELIPNRLIVIGYDTTSETSNDRAREAFLAEKELSNDVGYVGVYIDSVGMPLSRFHKYPLAYGNSTWKEILKKYVDRGDFFSGEFAAFGWSSTGVPSSGTRDSVILAYSAFCQLKFSYFRVHNLTTDSSRGSIKDSFPESYYIVNNALSIVGFRFVLSLVRYAVNSGTSVSLYWTITNIGLNKCWFDIYRFYYRIVDLDNDSYTDELIDVSACDIVPSQWAVPGRFSLGMGKQFEKTFSSLPTHYSINVIGKDVLGLQSPFYFSNYDRQEDGSYILYSNQN